MLTIEREVSQVEELVKQIDPGLENQQKKLKNSSPKTKSNKSIREIILDSSDLVKLLGQKIETNWQDYTKEETIENLNILLQKVNDLIKTLKKSEPLLSQRKDSSNFKGFILVALKKELQIFNKSLTYLSQVINDAIEFINIASEVTELRSKPTTESKNEKIKQILAKSKEVCEQKKELSKEKIGKDMKCILEAMRKHK